MLRINESQLRLKM